MTEIRRVPVAEIRLDDRCQPRAESVQADAVLDYAAAYRDGAELPPVRVFEVTEGDSAEDLGLYLVDGFHRVGAAHTAGIDVLRVEVVGSGDIDDAQWAAASQNRAHGVRRTNADKRRAVELALTSGVGEEQSSRAIAEWVGVSHQLVATIRQELEDAPRAIVGRDGRVYPPRTLDETGTVDPTEDVGTTDPTDEDGEEPDGAPAEVSFVDSGPPVALGADARRVRDEAIQQVERGRRAIGAAIECLDHVPDIEGVVVAKRSALTGLEEADADLAVVIRGLS